MEQTLRVNKIYPAYMGEVNKFGIGYPCTFVRLAGCNLRCYYLTMGILCDTPEALSMRSGKQASILDIVENVHKLGNKLVCLTGGEPLMQENAVVLLRELTALGYDVVVETNGSFGIYPMDRVSYVVDYKLHSTGETDKMVSNNWDYMDGDDYLKFVVYDMADYKEMISWVHNHKAFRGNIAAGLCWGAPIGYVEFSKMLQKDCLKAILNMQTHKMEVMYDLHKDTARNIFIPKDL